MSVENVAKIKETVRSMKSTDLYGVLRLCCSNDEEAAKAIEVLDAGGGYKELKDGGLTATEATRCLGIALLNTTSVEGADAFIGIANNINDKSINYLTFLLGTIGDFDGGNEKLETAVNTAIDSVLDTVTARDDKDQLAHIILSGTTPPILASGSGSGGGGGGGGYSQSEIEKIIEGTFPALLNGQIPGGMSSIQTAIDTSIQTAEVEGVAKTRGIVNQTLRDRKVAYVSTMENWVVYKIGKLTSQAVLQDQLGSKLLSEERVVALITETMDKSTLEGILAGALAQSSDSTDSGDAPVSGTP